MEEGTKSKKTIFVGGISDDTNEETLYETFSTFGDILEVQLPPPANQHQTPSPNDPKHRGFAFLTFASPADAQDAIDNMDMNELRGRVLKVNLARPFKAAAAAFGSGGQANRAIWESEEWLKENVKPLSRAGGVQARMHTDDGEGEGEGGDGDEDAEGVDDKDAMEE